MIDIWDILFLIINALITMFASAYPDKVKLFLQKLVGAKKIIFWTLYVLYSSFTSIYFIVTFTLIFVKTNVINIALLTLLLLIILALIGVWRLILTRFRFWSSGINLIVNLLSLLLVISILILFWIFSWPDFLLPLAITVITVVILGYFIGQNSINKKHTIKS